MSLNNIAALVSVGRHPTSGQPRYCHNDSLAMRVGLKLSEQTSAQLQILHAGDAHNPALKDYLALGANEIKVVSADAIIENIAENLKSADLILTGSRAESGQDSGLLPYMLAAKLNIPIIANALEVKQIGDKLEILQFFPKGKRRRVAVNLPAFVTIHPLAPVELRYAHKRQQQGKIVTLSNAINTTTKSQLQWQIEPRLRKPIKLKAPENFTGHARLLVAISSESKGGAVVNEGNCVEKAQVILNYLREHHLINF